MNAATTSPAFLILSTSVISTTANRASGTVTFRGSDGFTDTLFVDVYETEDGCMVDYSTVDGAPCYVFDLNYTSEVLAYNRGQGWSAVDTDSGIHESSWKLFGAGQGMLS